ncbi:Uncharacterized protein DBV15_12495 [Temnothorax longispinosus]|uniref:DDE Tnp4 domain-containing protein n=1 Tax=Temnothorax longispinosus TaxID=300112 RepID=A0A4S2KUI7_9HYME|nr:Uncharacterized protein DBV15_12495 [Temnothorax longispinosus]
MISPEKQLLIALWRMATPDSYRSIHTRFGVGKATAIRAVRRVTMILCYLSPKFIQWPKETRAVEIMQGFAHIGAFPQTIGAIDGTHINIPAPKENPEAYINRKGHHSIQAQTVINRQWTSHTASKNYNFCLSSSRMSVERAIGLLKGRWRSLLHYLAMGSVEHIPYHFLACCVLHNICLIKNDELEALILSNAEAACPLQLESGGRNRGEAEAKRDLICATLQFIK